jgi:hypothetical protein
VARTWVLQDRPELQAMARHQACGLQHRLQAAEGGELVAREQYQRRARPLRQGSKLKYTTRQS